MNKRFRETRMKFNLTQKEFAQILGLKKVDIELIEKGKQKLSQETITVLRHKLKVDISWLMGAPSNVSPDAKKTLAKPRF
ncbi:helix-turn-helix transcriptional regulator [uncultured Clostridium sp.]|jgi:transcriptional regulator with XRE-family HTH domain|uniref:helix-turn-helix domain-containing protein n=1 Tax=uncultured Clostridium sp. TaxID=59620 RepID=UPI00261B28D1|nr:helix-turn-helix transcriptional regulator [uncultured Clostridium sp.]